MSAEKPWWYPQLADAEWIARLRADYPEDTAGKSDEEVRDKYSKGWKYVDTWDHLGDARAEYEQLADAYLALVATPPTQPSVSEGSVSADIEWTDTRDGDAPLVKLAAMLQALEMEPAAVNLSAQQLAVICRGITKVAKRASTPPAQPMLPSEFRKANPHLDGAALAFAYAAHAPPPQPSGSEGSVPEGFVLVPKEPTPKMVDATFNDPIETNGVPESHNTRNKRIYAAMIAAAPQPTTKKG